MKLNRVSIINRLQSKITTIDDFNFDILSGPSVFDILSMGDVDSLYNIATSIRYAGNPEKKYKAINDIMKPRGFIKLSAGTNRVAYKFLEDNRFIFKVAADNIGMGDNPKEFKNQMLLKPFVTKIFEVDPTGVVASVEKVKPITSREEFLSIADDVYELLTKYILGRFVMADIGSKYFMNYGLREGFGPVLLDLPYLYDIDVNKLYCSALLPDGSRCGGLIDYDDGFNDLFCTKCGAKYRARELAKKIEENEIIERGRAKKMKIKVYAKRIMSNGEVTVSEAKEDPIREKETAKVIPQNTSGTPVGKLKLNIHTEMKDAHQNNNRHQNYNNNHNNNNQRNNGNNGYQRGIVRDKGNTIIRANTSRSEEFTKKSLEETQTVYKKVPLTIDKVSTYTFAPVDYDVENGVLSLKALEDNSIAISTEIKKYPEYIDMIATSANYTRSIEEELEYAKADLHQKEDACILLQRANDELKKQIEEQSDSNASEDSTSINDLNNTIKELSENIETLKAENKDLGDAISQMTTELEESGKSYESDQMLLKKLRAEVENLRAQKENLTNMLSDANDKLEAFGADTTDVFRESPEDLAAIAEMPVIDQYQAYSEEFKNIEAELTSFNDLSEENEYTKNHRILSCKPRHDQPEYILDADGKILTIVSINGIAIDDLAIIGKSEYEELKSEDSNRTEEPVDEESTMESVEAPVGSVQQ